MCIQYSMKLLLSTERVVLRREDLSTSPARAEMAVLRGAFPGQAQASQIP